MLCRVLPTEPLRAWPPQGGQTTWDRPVFLPRQKGVVDAQA